jgi:hypothetical protein
MDQLAHPGGTKPLWREAISYWTSSTGGHSAGQHTSLFVLQRDSEAVEEFSHITLLRLVNEYSLGDPIIVVVGRVSIWQQSTK